MKIIKKHITLAELSIMAKNSFGDMVKAVVDIKNEIMAVDADLHADLEAELLNNGSLQSNLWGINIYPFKFGDDFIEFDSMINLRPSVNNHSRYIENEQIRNKILTIVTKLITK